MPSSAATMTPAPPPIPTPSPIASPNPTTATTAKNRPSRTDTPMRPGTFGNAAFHAEPRSVRRPITAPRSTVNRIAVRIGAEDQAEDDARSRTR